MYQFSHAQIFESRMRKFTGSRLISNICIWRSAISKSLSCVCSGKDCEAVGSSFMAELIRFYGFCRLGVRREKWHCLFGQLDFKLARVRKKNPDWKAPEAKRVKSDDFPLVLPLTPCLMHEVNLSNSVSFFNSCYTWNAMPPKQTVPLFAAMQSQSAKCMREIYGKEARAAIPEGYGGRTRVSLIHEMQFLFGRRISVPYYPMFFQGIYP